MATLDQLKQALINADKAGDTDAARQLAAFINVAQKDAANLIPGTHIPGTTGYQEPSLGQKAVGVGETALTAITGATGGAIGMAAGGLGQLAANILRGDFGTPEANRLVEETAMRGAQALTYEPKGQAGQEYAQALGQTVAEVLPPVLPQIAPTIAMQGARQAAPVVSAAGARAGQAAERIGQIASRTTEVVPGRRSVGAAETPMELQRVATAQTMPVPFEGRAALTKGQASRDFAQLQFEKESAKLGDVGAPLRERVQNQTAVMLQNFDAMVDRLEPIAASPRDIGKAVDRAIVYKAEVMRRRIDDAYTKAREAGAMADPVDVTGVAATLDDLSRYEGVAPNVSAIRKEAVRLGVNSLVPDEAGVIKPSNLRIEDAELLRQFVNEVTDWTDKRESLLARKINSSIDDATQGAGGELYKKARNLRSEYASEFENVGLTSKLLSTKGKTSERQIALEDVFDKVIVLSPLEEMNKVRRTLITAGPDGKQAWNDLKAQGIQYIKSKATSPSQTDSAGNPLIIPNQFAKIVKQLDAEGKLESLYGKKQAQIIRDLSDLAQVIYTAPPGAINTSNTASALRVALDSVATFAVTGIPAPATTALRESLRYVKDRKLKARINDALKERK